jgi:hypothetical protein
MRTIIPVPQESFSKEGVYSPWSLLNIGSIFSNKKWVLVLIRSGKSKVGVRLVGRLNYSKKSKIQTLFFDFLRNPKQKNREIAKKESLC